MTKRLTLFVLLLFTVGAVSAKTVKFKKAGVKITIPRGYHFEMEDGMLQIESKDEALGIFMAPVEGDSLEKAGDELEKQVKAMIPDFKEVGEGEEIRINKMPAFIGEGEGTLEGKAVEVGVMMVVTPKHKVLLIFGVILKSATKKHEKKMEKMFMSLKPL